MKPGTVVKLPDGREGTVVYNGLDGVGIIWGHRALTENEVDALLSGHSFKDSPVDMGHLKPQAMLRDPYPSAELECVGKNYAIIEEDFI